MKIRIGFVSNSSSSSFCALLLSAEDSKKILQQIERHWDVYDYGRLRIKGNLLLYTSREDRIGIEIGGILAEGTQNISDLKDQLTSEVKEYFNLEVHRCSMTFDYGEIND